VRRLLVLTLAFGALVPPSAQAHVSPMGCASSSLTADVSRDRSSVRPGQAVTYTVTATNQGGVPCDVTAGTVTFTRPALDGTPTGASTALTQNTAFGAGMAPTVLGTPQWTAAVNPGVLSGTAQVAVTGTLHDGPGDSAIATQKTIGVAVVDPKLSVTVKPTPDTGQAPLPVTFHYELKNLSVPPDPLTNPTINHPLCTPAAYASGDTDGDNAIDAGETWDMTCTRVFTTGGEYSATAVATATSASDGLTVDATAASTTVKVAPPVSTAHLTLTSSASPASGFAPLNVTYTYTVVNDGPVTPVSDVKVQDGACGPVVTSAPNAPLGAGASRVFTCSAVFGVGVFTSTAVASGVDTVANTAVTSARVSTEIAVSSPAPVPTAVPQPAPSPTATPTPAPKPSTRVKFSYTGRFTPARSCRGTVTLTLKTGTKKVATKRVKLDRKCRYKVAFDVARSSLGKATTVTVTAKAGNRSASRRLSIPKR
jgi:uncharacterized repeat protein (TIGR01451 family)